MMRTTVVLGLLPFVAGLNVAIIGAGAGGTSAAWWLRKLRPDIQIDVYERRNHAGGRVFTKNVFGVDVEAGASMVIKENKYFLDWARMFNLTLEAHPDGVLAIDNGREFVFEGKLSIWQILWRYGVRAPYYMQKFAGEMIAKFNAIYDAQDHGTFYRSAEELWASLGLLDDAMDDCEKVLGGAIGQSLDGLVMNELVAGASRANYNQRPRYMTGLACAMAIAPSSSKGVLGVKQGNMEVFQRVLKDAAVTAHYHTYVKSVDQLGNGSFSLALQTAPVGCGPRGDEPHEDGSFPNSCANSDGCFDSGNSTTPTEKKNYDAVVIATPQFFDDIPQFNQTIAAPTKRRYLRVFTTFTCGEARRGGSELQQVLLTGDADTPINSLGRGPNCDNGKPLWKVVSIAKLSAADIDKYLDRGNSTDLVEFQWYAYPKFDANDIPKLQLAPGLFYAPAVEAATSAMEVSIVSGRNAALLVHDFLKAREIPSEVIS
eukprot:GEMP01041489.1.p1 GENE.GEMP01041489.1~~GEMP01041489.1.p1  ORF type:complete len:486 (+),score=111.95 GEMP01041489.1:41-1498(+)